MNNYGQGMILCQEKSKYRMLREAQDGDNGIRNGTPFMDPVHVWGNGPLSKWASTIQRIATAQADKSLSSNHYSHMTYIPHYMPIV